MKNHPQLNKRWFRTFWLTLILTLTVIACWLGGVTAVQAAGTPDRVLTLAECLTRAFEASPAIDSANKTVEGAEWQKKKASKDFLPKFTVNYQYTRLDEVPMSPGSTIPTGIAVMPVIKIPSKQAGTKDNYQLVFSITQPIFAGFAILTQYQLSKLGLDVAEIAREQAKLDLVLQVKQSYFSVLQAEKSLDVADQSVKQLDAHLKDARSFYDVGMVPKNQVLQAEVKMADAVQKRVVAENQLKYTRAGLNTLLRRDLEASMILEDILQYRPFTRTLPESTTQALDKRPEIKAALGKINIQEKQTQLTKSSYYPQVNVSYNNISKGDTWTANGSPYLDNANQWNVTATATWTFWEWGKTYNGVQANKTEEVKARNVLTQVQDGVRLEVKQAFLNLEAAGKNIFVSEKALESAEENFRMSNERYKEQVTTATEVTDAETLLTQARLNKYTALYNYNLAWATLERAVGVDRL